MPEGCMAKSCSGCIADGDALHVSVHDEGRMIA
jgi:hypothetical protein